MTLVESKYNLNEIKKHLGIKKKQLILLACFKMYNKDFDDMHEACEWISKKLKEAQDD